MECNYEVALDDGVYCRLKKGRCHECDGEITCEDYSEIGELNREEEL